MRQVTIAAIQMACERVDDKAFNPNIKKALELSRKAAQAGAQIILLPELLTTGTSARRETMIPTS